MPSLTPRIDDVETRITTLEEPKLYVELRGSNASAVTANTQNIHFDIHDDPFSLWNASNREITIPVDGDGLWSFSGMYRTAANTDNILSIYVDKGSGYVIEKAVSGNVGLSQSKNFNGVFLLQEGWKAALRTNTGATLENNDSLHNMMIVKLD